MSATINLGDSDPARSLWFLIGMATSALVMFGFGYASGSYIQMAAAVMFVGLLAFVRVRQKQDPPTLSMDGASITVPSPVSLRRIPVPLILGFAAAECLILFALSGQSFRDRATAALVPLVLLGAAQVAKPANRRVPRDEIQSMTLQTGRLDIRLKDGETFAVGLPSYRIQHEVGELFEPYLSQGQSA